MGFLRQLKGVEKANHRLSLNPPYLVAALVMLASGCVRTQTTPTSSVESNSPVAVHYSEPERDYEELGLVSTQTGQTVFHDRSTEGMIEKLQAEAAALGADAIIVRSTRAGSWGMQGGGRTGFDRGYAEAVAIRYK